MTRRRSERAVPTAGLAERGTSGPREDQGRLPDPGHWHPGWRGRPSPCQVFGLCVCGQGVARSLVLHRSCLSCGEESQPGGWTERPGRAQSSAVTSIDTTRLDEPTSGRRAEREEQRFESKRREVSQGARGWPSGPRRTPQVERKHCLEGQGVALKAEKDGNGRVTPGCGHMEDAGDLRKATSVEEGSPAQVSRGGNRGAGGPVSDALENSAEGSGKRSPWRPGESLPAPPGRPTTSFVSCIRG